jgi:transcriptional regulator with XRE-family HTH domain
VLKINLVDHLYVEFGRLVRQRRKEARITQLTLAKRVGLGRTSITNIELGRQHIPIHVLYPLAAALGTTPDKLLPAGKFAVPGDDPQTLDPQLLKELAKQDLAAPAKRWVQRVVLKTAINERGVTDESPRASTRATKGTQDKARTRTS